MYVALSLLLLNVQLLSCQGSSCKENEMHVDCVSAFCGPKTCDDLGYPVPCPGGTAACHGGCVCIDGYVRDNNRTCIPMKDCPSCGGDTNSTTGCGNHCGNTCSDFMEVNKTCLSGCRYNGCKCKEGYVFSEKFSKCVLPNDCGIPVCSKNETWTNCIANCTDEYCPSSDDHLLVCDPPNPCNNGCRCDHNYRRNATGDCILASECPPVECTRQNEVWDPCPSACLFENCSTVGSKELECKPSVFNHCQPKCVCKKDHFKNENGLCVPAKECGISN